MDHDRNGAGMTAPALRPEILQSWKRCEAAGLRPTRDLNSARQQDVEYRSALLMASAPVLDRLLEHLDGLSFAVLLADSGARLAEVRCSEPDLAALIERTGAVAGQLLSEENSGTNSLATAFELRQGVAVHGREHYLEALQGYSCYGQPIFNRATGRIEGVLDITCGSAQDNLLLKPFLARAVQEIQERLLESGRVSQAGC